MEALVSKYLLAEQALKKAEAEREAVKAELEKAYAEAGITYAEANGKRVSVISAERRAFDVVELAKHITASTYEAVTKVTVEPKAFDKAREAGDITEATEQAVTTITHYNRVTVTQAQAVASAQVA